MIVCINSRFPRSSDDHWAARFLFRQQNCSAPKSVTFFSRRTLFTTVTLPLCHINSVSHYLCVTLSFSDTICIFVCLWNLVFVSFIHLLQCHAHEHVLQGGTRCGPRERATEEKFWSSTKTWWQQSKSLFRKISIEEDVEEEEEEEEDNSMLVDNDMNEVLHCNTKLLKSNYSKNNKTRRFRYKKFFTGLCI